MLIRLRLDWQYLYSLPVLKPSQGLQEVGAYLPWAQSTGTLWLWVTSRKLQPHACWGE